MKKICLDANILVSVINKQYPVYPFAARVLSLSDDNRFKVCTSATCLAIAFYFAEKKRGATVAKKVMGLLLEKMAVVPCGQVEAKAALQNKKVHDYEDGLEYYAALHAGCKYIITEDIDDFYFSEIEVLPSEVFIKNLLNS